MKVTTEKTENRQAYLTIELEPAEIENATKMAYRRLVTRANVPGFRRGKAPQAILERYLGKDAIREEALNQAIPQAYEDALKEQGIEPVAQPQIEITQNEPVIFKAIVPLKPIVEIGDYQSIRIPEEKAESTEESVKDVITDLRHQHATWEPVDRPVAFGDLAVLSVHSTADGKPFFNQDSVQYIAREGSASPVKGFAEQIVGMKKDEAKGFKLAFPEGYPDAELVGKEADFEVKVIEVKEEKLPELNDALAKQVSPDYETLDSLRNYVASSLNKRVDEKARADYENKVVEAAVNVSKVEFPPVVVEDELDSMMNEQARRLQMAGAGGIEEYLKITKKTPQQLRDDLRPAAIKRVTRHLVLDKIAGDRKIEASEEEVHTGIDSMLQESGPSRERMEQLLGTPQGHDSIHHYLRTRKTIEELVKIAQQGQEPGEEKAPVPKEVEK